MKHLLPLMRIADLVGRVSDIGRPDKRLSACVELNTMHGCRVVEVRLHKWVDHRLHSIYCMSTLDGHTTDDMIQVLEQIEACEYRQQEQAA